MPHTLQYFINHGTKYPFYNGLKVAGLDQGDAAYFAILLPARYCELVSRLDACPFPKLLGQDHLSPLIHGDDRFDGTAACTLAQWTAPGMFVVFFHPILP